LFGTPASRAGKHDPSEHIGNQQPDDDPVEHLILGVPPAPDLGSEYEQ
jgi:hypothetical protein